MGKRVININVLPGEPLDGTGTVCIHLFVPDERGPFVEPSVTCMATVEQDGHAVKRLSTRPTRGRLACDRKRTVAPVTRGGVTMVTPRTNDPRAVTCLKCKASADYARTMEAIEGAVK